MSVSIVGRAASSGSLPPLIISSYDGGRRTKSGEARAFLEYAKTYRGRRCLKWPYATFSEGRGCIRINRKNHMVHRIICEEFYGPPPFIGAEACHDPVLCNDSTCINGLHLRWDTNSANQNDRVISGTSNRGRSERDERSH